MFRDFIVLDLQLTTGAAIRARETTVIVAAARGLAAAAVAAARVTALGIRERGP